MLELRAIPMGAQVRARAERDAFLAELGPIHSLTGRPSRRCPGCGHWSGIVGMGAALCFSCSDPDPCPDCEEPWPDRFPACPFCGLTLVEVADRLAGENPSYGPGNPDWERDFEKTCE